MLDRISTRYSFARSQRSLEQGQRAQVETQNRVQTQRKINKPHEDPTKLSQASESASVLSRLKTYQNNMETLSAQLNLKVTILQQIAEHISQVRLDVLQGLNDTYNTEDRYILAQDVEQQLQAMLDLANRQDGTGNYLFAGTNYRQLPFFIEKEFVENSSIPVITRVDYTGSSGRFALYIDDEVLLDSGGTGNDLFWGINQRLGSTTSLDGFVLNAPVQVFLDDTVLNFAQGATAQDIVQTINSSIVAAFASLTPQGALELQTTSPHELRLWEAPTGTFWQDLGLLDEQGTLLASVEQEGFPFFQYVMDLRDALLLEDKEALNENLYNLDLSTDTLLSHITQMGAKDKRLELALDGVKSQQVVQEDRQNQLIGADLAEELLNYKEQELHYRAMLGISARLGQTTLLDSMR